MNINTKQSGFNIPVIKQGKVFEGNLKMLNLNKMWLDSQLANNNINNAQDVFYADINPDGKLYISKGQNPDNYSKSF